MLNVSSCSRPFIATRTRGNEQRGEQSGNCEAHSTSAVRRKRATPPSPAYPRRRACGLQIRIGGGADEKRHHESADFDLSRCDTRRPRGWCRNAGRGEDSRIEAPRGRRHTGRPWRPEHDSRRAVRLATESHATGRLTLAIARVSLYEVARALRSLLLLSPRAVYFAISTSATMFNPLSARTRLPSCVGIMLRTTPPPPGIAHV